MPASRLCLPDNRWTPSAINNTVATGDWDCLVQSPRGRYLWLRLKFFSDGVDSPCIDHVRIHYPRASSLQYLPAVYSDEGKVSQILRNFISNALKFTERGEIRVAASYAPNSGIVMLTPSKR